MYLSCTKTVPHCTSIKYKIALPLVADKIVDALQNHRTVSDITAGTLELNQKINAAQERRRKIQEGFENNLYTPAEASKRITAIETEIEKYTNQIARLTQQHQHQTALLQIANTDLTQLRNWILNDDPTTVNRLLTALCEKILVAPKTHELTIIFR